VEIISTPVVVAVVVVVVVVMEVEIISTQVAVVAVGGGGDYLDTCSGSSRSISRALLFGVCSVDN
jgi:hypothetical protein